jgi:ABC-2 type transport system permease protein
MMSLAASIFRKTLHDVRWQIIWYGLGFGLMAAMVVYLYPSYSSQITSMELPDAVKALMGGADYATGRGFLGAEIFSWAAPILCVFGIMAGTSILAGEEVNGTLDVLLAQPISRTTLMLSKLAGVFAASLSICAVICAGWLVSVPFVNIDVGFGELTAATFNLALTMAFFAAFSAWAGAQFAGRGAATGVAVALAVASFFVSYLAELVDAIRPLRYASVFYYNGGAKAITQGVDPVGFGVLLALTALFIALGLRAFNRRDLSSRGASSLLSGITSLWRHRAAEATS